jgi:hypothetical protein
MTTYYTYNRFQDTNIYRNLFNSDFSGVEFANEKFERNWTINGIIYCSNIQNIGSIDVIIII